MPTTQIATRSGEAITTERATTKGERTRARILAAAAEHFAAVGFDGSSVPEIARQVGVSHATLYQHFGRKDELFRAAVEDDLTALFDTLRPALTTPDLDPDSLVGLLPELVAHSRRHPLARRVLAQLDAEQTEALRDLPALITLEAHLTNAITSGQQRRLIRRDLSAHEIATGVIALMLPMVVVAFRLDGMTDIPRADHALIFLADSLRPPTPSRSRSNR